MLPLGIRRETHRAPCFSVDRGKRKRGKELIEAIRAQLIALREEGGEKDVEVKQTSSTVAKNSQTLEASAGAKGFKLGASKAESAETKAAIEREYEERDTKVDKLNKALPDIKSKLCEFFESSTGATAVFAQLDDFYHLRQSDQPYVMDYVHRLCKDVPLFFKVATLRHVSTLYADREGQPTGAQERHDYQPINIDFSFENFARTKAQFHRILREFDSEVGIPAKQMDDLFKGDGFSRLGLFHTGPVAPGSRTPSRLGANGVARDPPLTGPSRVPSPSPGRFDRIPPAVISGSARSTS